MKKHFTKKRVVLLSLFILPLVFFLVLSTGINNFKKLPVVTERVLDLPKKDSLGIQLEERISIICFLGSDVELSKGGIFNLNQKIYKPFYGFNDFQLIAIYPKTKRTLALDLQKKIAEFTDMSRWRLVGLDSLEIEKVYQSFDTGEPLVNLQSNKAFIVDKDLNLRGRNNDEDTLNGILFGYNMNSVAELNNKMKDDVKIVLAEYRLALKREKNKRKI